MRPRLQRSGRKRGVAALTAILLLALVAATLATVATFFITENRRTRAQATEAQLRQLLTAAATVAKDRLNNATADGEYVIALPAELDADGVKLTITLQRDNEYASAYVHAKLQERSSEQTLRFERRGGKWQITDVIIGADHPEASTQPSDRSTAASQRS